MSASQHRIYFLLQRAAHALKAEADSLLLSATGLTTAQIATLTVIAEHQPTTQRFVANTLQQRESAVASMTTRLVKGGFATRLKSTRDARALELRVTQSGKAALRTARVSFAKVNSIIDAEFSSTEVEQLAQSLTQLIDSTHHAQAGEKE